jgi:hypothetical protein
MAYSDGHQDHQPFLKEWMRHGKEYRSCTQKSRLGFNFVKNT